MTLRRAEGYRELVEGSHDSQSFHADQTKFLVLKRGRVTDRFCFSLGKDLKKVDGAAQQKQGGLDYQDTRRMLQTL